MPLQIVDYMYYMRPVSFTREELEKARKLIAEIRAMIPDDMEFVYPAKAPEPVRCPGDWMDRMLER